MKQSMTIAAVVCFVFILTGCKKGGQSTFPEISANEPIAPLVATEPGITMDTTLPDFPLISEPVAAANRHHTVRLGDTLWSIAKRTYGDGQRWREIVAANPGVAPRKLKVGQQLVLP